MTEDDGSRRLELVRTAQARWIDALTDLGGRNTLLYYKDRRAGTLDLAGADPDALDRFLRTGSIRLTRLFHDVDARADAIRRVQAIYRKARELLEERGIRAGFLATGMAALGRAVPRARRAGAVSRAHDHADAGQVRRLRADPGRRRRGQPGPAAQARERLRGRATRNWPPQDQRDHRAAGQGCRGGAEVPGFGITHRRVIGTFTYAKLPMVRDCKRPGTCWRKATWSRPSPATRGAGTRRGRAPARERPKRPRTTTPYWTPTPRSGTPSTPCWPGGAW